MARVNVVKNNFTSGELSPELDARFDSQLYGGGVRTLENFITLREGAISRRPGTEHIASAIDNTKKVRLIPYERGNDNSYIIELSDQTMRVYKNGAQLTGGSFSGTGGSIATPWSDADIFDLQFAQDTDANPSLWVVHPDYDVRKIVYTNDTSWAITEISGDSWTPANQFGATDDDNPRSVAFYQQRLIFGGTKNNPQTIWGSRSPNANGNRYTDFSLSDNGPSRTVLEVTQANLALFTTNAAHYFGVGDRVKFRNVTGMTKLNNKTYEINTVPDEAEFTLRYTNDAYGVVDTTGDDYDAFGFGFVDNVSSEIAADHGFEFSIASDRVNAAQWLQSGIVLFYGTNGGEWIVADVAPDGVPAINKQSTYGSLQGRSLLVNDSVVFIQRGGEIAREMTFQDIRGSFVSRDLTTLSRHILKTGVSNMDFQQEPQSIIWFVRNDGQIATLTYDREEGIMGWARQVTKSGDKFESVAVIGSDGAEDEVWVSTVRSVNGSTVRHIERFKPRRHFDSTTREEVWYLDDGKQDDQGPTKTITGVNRDTQALVTCTGHGFSDGDLVLIEDLVGPTDINDKIFKVANQTTNNFKITDENDVYFDSTALADWVSGGTATRVVRTISGLSHLEGETVTVVTDGATHPDRTVASGSISLQVASNTTNVGLPYTSVCKPMKVEAGGQLGASLGQPKRIARVILRVLDTVSGKVGSGLDSLETIPARGGGDAMGDPPPLSSEDYDMKFRGGFETEGNVVVVQDLPQPMTLLAIVLEMETHDVQ